MSGVRVSAAPAARQRMELLDVLRFLAAVMVVCFHWFFNGIDNGKVPNITHLRFASVAVYGYFGVHLFFLISGYVIAQSAEGRSASRFAVSRAVRLYPAYWFAMVATTTVSLFWGGRLMHVSPSQFLANLTMAPGLLHRAPLDGAYWTLSIELTFYLLVFALLFLGLGHRLAQVFPAWALLMLAVTLVAPQLPLADVPFSGGYYALFAGGAITAAIQRHGFSVYRVVGLVAAFAAACLFLLRKVAVINAERSIDVRPAVVMVILLVFFALIASMWVPAVARLHLPFSRPVSDLTYPVYLLHAHIGYMVLAHLATEQNKLAVYAGMFVALIAGSWLLHEVVEVRLKTVWFGLFTLVLGRPVAFLQRRSRLGQPATPTPAPAPAPAEPERLQPVPTSSAG